MKIFSKFLRTISSYNSSILLAALVSLLLVILFVLLLHFYARYFWSVADEARRRRRRRRRRVITRIPSASIRGFLDNNTNNVDTLSTASAGDGSCTKGLDSWVISSIPLFVYEDDEEDEEECVICLSMLEVGDVGRKLGQCGHKFHVECIDMWLTSNSSCPLCRSSAVATRNIGLKPTINNNNDDNINGVEEIRLQVFPGEGDDDNDRFVAGDDGSRPENVFDHDHDSGSSSSSSPSSAFGCSLKRILSRGRSERKVFPSSSNNNNNNNSSEPSNS